ncbi:hypothetical protein PCANC_16791 [Puccinia coronata f. sp. avenae]|uniref:Uncharacterized protein n=1 Tax=Puccinia coronata f. sp. avenae TaxID=200324 RepID=A0A2N5UP03_9BASI|nr:hypothetical protein PCANC_25340 [Puccinia coronata f. sp. avenae]PLW39490.1 hypothetical protein PCANC_16791 [Puccinia coronata f. sp. avenae]
MDALGKAAAVEEGQKMRAGGKKGWTCRPNAGVLEQDRPVDIQPRLDLPLKTNHADPLALPKISNRVPSIGLVVLGSNPGSALLKPFKIA